MSWPKAEVRRQIDEVRLREDTHSYINRNVHRAADRQSDGHGATKLDCIHGITKEGKQADLSCCVIRLTTSTGNLRGQCQAYFFAFSRLDLYFLRCLNC